MKYAIQISVQGILQSHTADKPTAPWGRATEHYKSGRHLKQIKYLSLSFFLVKMIAKLEMKQRCA